MKPTHFVANNTKGGGAHNKLLKQCAYTADEMLEMNHSKKAISHSFLQLFLLLTHM